MSSYLAANVGNLENLQDSVTPSLKPRVDKVAQRLKSVSIDKVVTLGSPLSGTTQTWILDLFKIPYVTQMQRDSAFTQKLQQAILSSQKNTKYLHFGTKEDLLMQPVDSCLIRGQNHQNIPAKGYGHMSLMFSYAINDRIIDFYRVV